MFIFCVTSYQCYSTSNLINIVLKMILLSVGWLYQLVISRSTQSGNPSLPSVFPLAANQWHFVASIHFTMLYLKSIYYSYTCWVTLRQGISVKKAEVCNISLPILLLALKQFMIIVQAWLYDNVLHPMIKCINTVIGSILIFQL